MASYMNVYKSAKALYDDNRVQLEAHKEEDGKHVFYYQCDDKEVRLTILKLDNQRQWTRSWRCTCSSYALLQEKVECKHILACLLHLVNEA